MPAATPPYSALEADDRRVVPSVHATRESAAESRAQLGARCTMSLTHARHNTTITAMCDGGMGLGIAT